MNISVEITLWNTFKILHCEVHTIITIVIMATEAKKQLSSYNPAWEKGFPVSSVYRNKYAFYCIPCKKNIFPSHMGSRTQQECSNHKDE